MQTKTHNSLTLLTATAAFLFIGATIPTARAVNTWDGGAGNGNWNSPANWDDNLVPATSNNLTFSGDVQTSTTNDIVGFTAGSGGAGAQAITFGNTGAVGTNAFTLAGNQITLVAGSGSGGSIISSNVTVGSITDTISLNLSFAKNATISTGTNHNLIITGLLTQASGKFGLIKTGSGELIVRNAGNNYLDTTTFNAGTLTVDVAGGIQNAGTNSALGAGTNVSSQLNFAGGTLNVTLGAGGTDRQVRIGGTVSGNSAGANINNNSTNGGTPLVFSNAAFNVSAGAITTNRVLTLGGTNTDANEIRGVISDNNTVGGGLVSVTKVGAGRWVLSGSNSYSGSTTVGGTTGSSNGVLRIASVSSLPPNTTIVGSAGIDNVSTLELAPGSYSVKNYNRGNINFAATNGLATLEFTNTAVTNFLTQGAASKTIYSSNVAVRFAGTLEISAVADATTNKTATFSGNSDFTFDGPIIGPVVTNTNGSFTTAFVMNSTGVAVLNADNTYPGATDVKQGTLQVNGSISTNTLNISNGATLAGLGTVGGDVLVSGNLQPGRGATNGALTVGGSLTVASNGIVNLSIDSLAVYDKLAGASSYTVNGAINVTATTNYTPIAGDTFQLFSGAVGGTPTLSVTPLTNSGFAWVTNNFTSNGQISVTTNSATPAPSGLSYTPSSQTGTVGTAITNMTPAVTGTVTNYSVSPALPAGLSIDATNGVVGGTPTAATASANYTVTAANAGGSTTNNVIIEVVSQYNNWLQGQTSNSTNQLTYAIGGASSPTATNGVASTTAVTSDALSMTAIVRTNDTNLVVVGQSITNLSVGDWATTNVSMSVPVDQTGATPGTTQRQTFTTPRATNDAKKFLRLNTILSQ